MQDFVFASAHFTETCLSLLVAMGWMPVTVFTIAMTLGAVYWLNLQGRYNRRAKQDNTLA